MSTITDDSTFFGFNTFIGWRGQYGGSTGTQDYSTSLPTQTASLVAFNPSVGTKLTHGFNTYFKMQGFNNAAQKYEVWFSTGTPLLIPPSGNKLSNIEVVLTWIDR
jgi:hypothetical protein